MNWWPGFLMWAAIIVLVALPPKYDPAIRLKEWLMRRRK
jgi:hypothetical protein